MTTKKQFSSRYQQIAADLARQIWENKYPVGTKLHARSAVAAVYGVSPETARKAISILADLGIVEAKHGSGFFVASSERAGEFVTQYQEVASLRDLKGEVLTSVAQQKAELTHFSQLLDQLIDQTNRVQQANPLAPFELVLTAKAQHLDETIGALKIWQNTGATIVALRHKTTLQVSPGPYAKLSVDDCLYFVGNELVFQRMTHYFYPESRLSVSR
nr:GntR family transcriptional regulator [Lapidilactobacillus luobeiensis]